MKLLVSYVHAQEKKLVQFLKTIIKGEDITDNNTKS